MGLLGRIKQLISENEKPAEVTRVMAPLSGEIVPLDTVPDAVFAGKIVGDGIAIRPSGSFYLSRSRLEAAFDYQGRLLHPLTGDVSALAALLRNAGWYPIPAGTTDMAMFELSVIR
ncbi:TPA: PTS glucose transporter subunit IIA [Escherichia coli]|nr:PTS glucose transporter subunit IIA [Escherichia coli]